MFDIFNDDAFSLTSLTDAINDLEFVPGRVGELGIFLETSVSTTTVAIENKGNVLTLIPPTQRGAPGTTIDKTGKRNLRNLTIPHFEINDGFAADEVQGVRQWGSETQLETILGKVMERAGEHLTDHEVTIEHARLGAVKGIVTYADGSTLNLFTEFGVVQEALVSFDLGAAAPKGGVVRRQCMEITRTIAKNLGGVPYSGIYALCGNKFFDDLIQHKEVRDTYLNTQAAYELRNGYIRPGQKVWSSFTFGDITWENYRGEVGGTKFVDDDLAHFYPVGTPRLFRSYMAPADYNETVNTMGQRIYMRMRPTLNDKGMELDTQHNHLHICTRPKTLMKGTRLAP